MTTQNDQAAAFTAMHVPGNPVVLVNAWDGVSARAIAQTPSCRALATASAGVANTIGMADNELPQEANIYAAEVISQVAKEFNKPLTVDLQDCYGEKLEDTVEAVIKLGAVGLNIEDCDNETEKMYSVEEAAKRVQRVRAAATKQGVPNFHINARSDTLLLGGTLEETIQRGKAYLEAGASTIFVWGGPKRGTSREEIEQLVKAFDGKLNVSMRLDPGYLGVKELSTIGVARISIGPGLQRRAMQYVSQEADRIFKGA